MTMNQSTKEAVLQMPRTNHTSDSLTAALLLLRGRLSRKHRWENKGLRLPVQPHLVKADRRQTNDNRTPSCLFRLPPSRGFPSAGLESSTTTVKNEERIEKELPPVLRWIQYGFGSLSFGCFSPNRNNSNSISLAVFRLHRHLNGALFGCHSAEYRIIFYI
ncbi:hypothetical protein AV530_004674 [Patagioenas fasciata monilis]|uniref:Uncharacterized protein n=1 Tax=Patagioenas fasciata monilis TaxID=372326 RepID=A0A1V4KHT6_PATFA|nr:hypothetical protein AV530_004674 [Patagioenas fasciata monilis]